MRSRIVVVTENSNPEFQCENQFLPCNVTRFCFVVGVFNASVQLRQQRHYCPSYLQTLTEMALFTESYNGLVMEK